MVEAISDPIVTNKVQIVTIKPFLKIVTIIVDCDNLGPELPQSVEINYGLPQNNNYFC